MHRQRLLHYIAPKEWVEDIGLKRGSEIAFNIQPDSTLTLVPRVIMEKEGRDDASKPKEYCINIDSKEPPQATIRMIRALYAIGADIIRVHFKNTQDATKNKTQIKNLARDNFLGSEIIDETQDEITYKSYQTLRISIRKSRPKNGNSVSCSKQDAIAALKDRSTALFDSVISAHNDVNRLGLYIVRQLKHGIERNLYVNSDLERPKNSSYTA